MKRLAQYNKKLKFTTEEAGNEKAAVYTHLFFLSVADLFTCLGFNSFLSHLTICY